MLLSIVIPVYNEQESLPLLIRELTPILLQTHYDHEIIFVDDGSRDHSLPLLAKLAADDKHLKVLSFPRNFGHQAAVTAGLDFAQGDAVIVMDADLQDPPELIPEMLQLFEQGFDVVSPQRISREGDTLFKRKTASLFYLLMKKLVDKRLPPEVGDFRLFSHGAVVLIRKFREQHRFLRGLVAWLGLREAILPFERRPRAAGETKYPLRKMIKFSWTAITSFSALPLRICVFLGVIVAFLGIAYFLYALYAALYLKTVVPGWTSLVALESLFFGMVLFCLGLVGDYIGNIYEELKRRPLYVVGEAINLSAESSADRVVVLAPRILEGSRHDQHIY